jgi:hypothetical protein
MFRRLFVACAIVGVGVVAAPSASAQERVQLDLSTAVSNAVVPPVVLSTQQMPFEFDSGFRRQQPSSPLMTSLYVSTAVMQALDVHSTLQALDRGAVEGNPMMSGVTGNKAAFIALKSGVAFGTVMAARNMSKRNRVAAALTLVAINSAYAMVVNHNYKVARGGR